MSQNTKIAATVVVGLTWMAVLIFGGFKTDWPWNALWNDPAAIRWSEVLKVVAVNGGACLVLVLIWRREDRRHG